MALFTSLFIIQIYFSVSLTIFLGVKTQLNHNFTPRNNTAKIVQQISLKSLQQFSKKNCVYIHKCLLYLRV